MKTCSICGKTIDGFLAWAEHEVVSVCIENDILVTRASGCDNRILDKDPMSKYKDWLDNLIKKHVIK